MRARCPSSDRGHATRSTTRSERQRSFVARVVAPVLQALARVCVADPRAPAGWPGSSIGCPVLRSGCPQALAVSRQPTAATRQSIRRRAAASSSSSWGRKYKLAALGYANRAQVVQLLTGSAPPGRENVHWFTAANAASSMGEPIWIAAGGSIGTTDFSETTASQSQHPHIQIPETEGAKFPRAWQFSVTH